MLPDPTLKRCQECGTLYPPYQPYDDGLCENCGDTEAFSTSPHTIEKDYLEKVPE